MNSLILMSMAKELVKLATDKELEVRQAGKKGRGVFAKRAFKKGEVVDIAPLVFDFVGFKSKRLDAYPMKHGRRVAMLGGHAHLFNHSDEPNLIVERKDKQFTFRAAKDIEPGDELCYRYACKPWFKEKAAKDKTAIYLEALKAVRSGRVPRAAGRNLLELEANISKKISPRAPELAKQMQASVATMRKVHPEGEGIAVKFYPNQISAASPAGSIELGEAIPEVAGHEMGHIRDMSVRGREFMGDRGFLGFGGSVQSQLPAEYSATRQAFQATGKIEPSMAAGTATYVESAYPRVMERLQKAYLETARRLYPEQAQALKAKVQKISKGYDELLHRSQAGKPVWDARKSEIADRLNAEAHAFNEQLHARRLALALQRTKLPLGDPQRLELTKLIDELPKRRGASFSQWSREVGEAFAKENPQAGLVESLRPGLTGLLDDMSTRVRGLADPLRNKAIFENLDPRSQKLLGILRRGVARRLEKGVGPGAGEAADKWLTEQLARAPLVKTSSSRLAKFLRSAPESKLTPAVNELFGSATPTFYKDTDWNKVLKSVRSGTNVNREDLIKAVRSRLKGGFPSTIRNLKPSNKYRLEFARSLGERAKSPLVTIRHGGSEPELQAMMKYGPNSAIPPRVMGESGKYDPAGAFFHKVTDPLKDRVSDYAARRASYAGGTPAVLEAEIPEQLLQEAGRIGGGEHVVPRSLWSYVQNPRIKLSAKTAAPIDVLVGRMGAGKSSIAGQAKPFYDLVESTDTGHMSPTGYVMPPKEEAEALRAARRDRVMQAHQAGKRVLLEGSPGGVLKTLGADLGQADRVMYLATPKSKALAQIAQRAAQRGSSVAADLAESASRSPGFSREMSQIAQAKPVTAIRNLAQLLKR